MKALQNLYISEFRPITSQSHLHQSKNKVQQQERMALLNSNTMKDNEMTEEEPIFWFSENVTPVFRKNMGVKDILFNAQTPFQKVQIIDSLPFGKTLVLDG